MQKYYEQLDKVRELKEQGKIDSTRSLALNLAAIHENYMDEHGITYSRSLFREVLHEMGIPEGA